MKIKILGMRRALLVLVVILGTVVMVSAANGAPPAKLSVTVARAVYYRGENVKLEVAGGSPADWATLEAVFDGRVLASEKLQESAGGKSITSTLVVPTAGLRSGETYSLAIHLKRGGMVLASGSIAITVAARPNPGRLNVWLWSDTTSEKDQAFYRGIGFTSVGGPRYKDSAKTSVAVMERMMREGLDASVALQNGILRSDFVKPITGEDVDYVGADRNGENYYNPFNPKVAEAQNEANERFMRTLQDFPNLKFTFGTMEYVDDLTEQWLGADQNKEGLARMKRALGITQKQAARLKPAFVAPGVIADDDLLYRYWKYVWTGGNGIATVLRRAGDVAHRFCPDIQVISDPYRSVTFYNVYPKAVDVIESWTYTNPDPKAMLYVETMRAACKPLGQTPLQVVTLLNYPGTLAPKEKGWMLGEPDITKESTWINLSRAATIVGYYYSSACDPIKDAADTFRVPMATSEAIKEMSEKVFKPLGAMIGQLEVSPRKIAVLNSQVSRICNQSASLGGYPNQQIDPFYEVMAMDHLNADVLFDESILNGDLDGYDVLVLPKCDALLKTEYDKIRAFQRRGGVVVADQYLKPNIPNAMRFNFDFTYRLKVNADAIATGKMIADMGSNDHLDPNHSQVTTAAGVTAQTDQKIMESYAAELKRRLGGKVTPEADCDNPTVLLNMTQADGVKYLFVINDKRTYDARTGPYKAILGKLVPQDVTIRLNQWGDKPLYAYDLLEHKALRVDRQDKAPAFGVDLGEMGGTIVALYSEEPGALTINGPAQAKAGESCALKIAINDAAGRPLAGLQPVRVKVTDSQGQRSDYGGYAYVRNGRMDFRFVPALNAPVGVWTVEVSDLSFGFHASRDVMVR